MKIGVEVKTRKSRGTLRQVAGRPEILAAARSLGIRSGWPSVTIRAVAQELHYTAPLLYEHFRDKQEILTELAIEGQSSLAEVLASNLPTDPYQAILSMVDRFWSFMVGNQQIYRLMNAMDGVAVDRDAITAFARQKFEPAIVLVRTWLEAAGLDTRRAEPLFDEVWALLHGMATLYLDRSIPFHALWAQDCIKRLLSGTRHSAVGMPSLPQ